MIHHLIRRCPLTYSCQWQLSPCRANGRLIRQLISARRCPNALPPKTRVKKNTDFLKWPFWSALFELNVWGMEPIDDTRSHSPCSHLRETCAKYKLYISSLKIKKQNKKNKQTQNLFSGVGSVWSYIIHVFILSPEANPSPMLSIKSFIVIRPWVIMVSQTSSCDASPVQSAPCWSHSLQ